MLYAAWKPYTSSDSLVNKPSVSPPAADRPPAIVNPLPKSYEAAKVAELPSSVVPEPLAAVPPPRPAAVPEPQLPHRSVNALYVQAVE